MQALFRTRLRSRVLLLVVATFAALAGPAWYFFHQTIDNSILSFGGMIAERQVQYDRYRGMEALNREWSLAEAMSKSPAIIAWLAGEHDPDQDPQLRERGLADMEHYRRSFADKSVFVIADRSGRYYFNDAQNSYGDDPYSYTLRSDLPKDAWYFATRARREGCHPNVNVDDVLRVTKVWINCLVTEDGRIVGMVGSGIDLSAFIRDVVAVDGNGVESIFVDNAGAVQAHRDASLVDFRSITKNLEQSSTIFNLLSRSGDAVLLRSMMNEAATTGDVQTGFLTIGGKRQLIGVGHMPTVDWYAITVVDAEAVVDRGLFLPLVVLTIAVLLAAALILAWLFEAVVIRRIVRITSQLDRMRDGRIATLVPDRGADEIGQLSRALVEMTRAVADGRRTLEIQVRERTEQLEGLVNLDAMTGIANRRGFEAAFAKLAEMPAGDDSTNGLLLIDVDNFKMINDTEGHPAGDQVIVEVARRLKMAVRHKDVCGRWGGDEFIILIRNCNALGLQQVGAALRDMMRRMPIALSDGRVLPITISVGAVIVHGADTLEAATDMADAALYMAKEEGRDRVVLLDPAQPAGVLPETSAA